jgi:hypothetical protein
MYTEFNKRNLLNTLAYFIQMKAVYTAPIFYNKKQKDVAALIQVSVGTLSFHYNILKKEGLVLERDGNICFLGLSALCKKYKNKKIIQLKVGKHIRDTKKLTESFKILASLKSQEIEISKKKEIKTIIAKAEEGKFLTTPELKKFKKSLKNPKTIFSIDVILSNQGFADKCNKSSRSTGERRKKLLENYKLISTKRNKKQIDYVDVPIYTTKSEVLSWFMYERTDGNFPIYSFINLKPCPSNKVFTHSRYYIEIEAPLIVKLLDKEKKVVKKDVIDNSFPLDNTPLISLIC